MNSNCSTDVETVSIKIKFSNVQAKLFDSELHDIKGSNICRNL